MRFIKKIEKHYSKYKYVYNRKESRLIFCGIWFKINEKFTRN